MVRQVFLVCAILVCSNALAAQSLNPFSTAISVNGIGISHYELDQKERLLRSFNMTGDLAKQARETLISERLYLDEARRLGLEITEADIDSGVSEFAARASLEPEQFIEEVKKFGVTEETLSTFVRAGVAWRRVISLRFSQTVAQLGISDVEQSLAFQPVPNIVTVRLSEIALSLRPAAADRSREIADQIYSTVKSAEEFAEVAQSLSVADSRVDGGDIGWIALGRMPSDISSAIQVTPVGSVSRPIDTQSNVFVFFKHEVREEVGQLNPEVTNYSVLRVPADSNQTANERAQSIASRVQTCDELRSVSRDFPGGYFRANSVSADNDADRYTLELARLDSNETAVIPIADSDGVELLMLCSRRASLPDEQRPAVLSQKRDQKLADYASVLLSNLRANAVIIEH